MNIKRKLLLFLIIIFVMTSYVYAKNIELQNVNETIGWPWSQLKLESGESFEWYNELYLIDLEGKKNLVNKFHKRGTPDFNKNLGQLLYVEGEQGEERRVYIYDHIKASNDLVFKLKSNKDSYAPKVATWIDDRNILLVIGARNDSVSNGGKLYKYSLDSKKIKRLYTALDDNHHEYVDIYRKGEFFYLRVYKYDENYENYETFYKKIKIEDVKSY